MDKQTTRQSTFELIRIISVLGITGLHIYGQIKNQLSMPNVYVEILYCDIFAMAVPMFLLISGWFSVTLSTRKLASLHLMVLTYSILDFVIRYLMGDSVGIKDAVRAVFPILSYRFWYFSCYFLLLIFSPVVNYIVDNLPKKLYVGTILVWIIVVNTVSAFPTFGFVDDYLWKVLFYYFSGRFLRIYGLHFFKNKKTYLITGILLVLATYAANMLLTLILGKAITWFASDVFSIKEISAIFIFYYCCNTSFTCKPLNKIATFVPAVYLGESLIRFVIEKHFRYDLFYNSSLMIFVVFGIAIVTFAVVVVVESVRRFVSTPLEKIYVKLLEKLKIENCLKKIIDKV
ncbi:acyltransferase family protein [Butyrivibrio sp. FCS006]|uniref:acyltransferase family protein n=1 Tax=Butyrivibrio sp. FCS006 TaxID=1280684 RepID=UPI0004294905|nr:acyltransferase family protein [Butyrivibrio sp. FCS006]